MLICIVAIVFIRLYCHGCIGLTACLQALRVLKDMQQRKAFSALLAVSLAEASQLNARVCTAHMHSLDLSMHIAAGTLPPAFALTQQVQAFLLLQWGTVQ